MTTEAAMFVIFAENQERVRIQLSGFNRFYGDYDRRAHSLMPLADRHLSTEDRKAKIKCLKVNTFEPDRAHPKINTFRA